MTPTTFLPAPFLRALPEVSMGVDLVTTTAGQSVGTMTPTALTCEERTGTVHQGALGVLIDDTSALAVLSGRSPGQWGVSSVINVDFHAPVRASSGPLECQAELLSRNGDWGFARGEVRTADGALVATLDQRLRYLPGDASVHEEPWAAPDAAAGHRSLDELLIPVHSEDQAAEFRVTPGPEMANGLGTLHGGMGLCIAELAARRGRALMTGESGPAFHTSNLRTTYLRPGDITHDLAVRVQVVHASRSFAVLEVEILNADGALVIVALSTLHRSDGAWTETP